MVCSFKLVSHPLNCSFICNAPGSGNTRWMLEGLTAYWGLYFVTTPDSGHKLGVTDLSHTMELISQHPQWKTDLPSVPLGSELANTIATTKLQ